MSQKAQKIEWRLRDVSQKVPRQEDLGTRNLVMSRAGQVWLEQVRAARWRKELEGLERFTEPSREMPANSKQGQQSSICMRSWNEGNGEYLTASVALWTYLCQHVQFASKPLSFRSFLRVRLEIDFLLSMFTEFTFGTWEKWKSLEVNNNR